MALQQPRTFLKPHRCENREGFKGIASEIPPSEHSLFILQNLNMQGPTRTKCNEGKTNRARRSTGMARNDIIRIGNTVQQRMDTVLCRIGTPSGIGSQPEGCVCVCAVKAERVGGEGGRRGVAGIPEAPSMTAPTARGWMATDAVGIGRWLRMSVVH